MITKLQPFNFSFQSDDPTTYFYEFDQMFNQQNYNSISLLKIIVPKTIYAISTQFDIIIDGNTCTFYQGDISFQNLVSKLNNITADIFCIELNSDKYQTSGKLYLYKTGNVQFNITIPDNMKYLFGCLTQIEDPINFYYYQSNKLCNLLSNQIINVASNCFIQELKTNQNNIQIIESLAIDQVQLGQNYQEHFEVDSHRKIFSKVKKISFKFLDANYNDIVFQTNNNIYIEMALFNYEYKFVDKILNSLQQGNYMFQLKNFKKQTLDKIFNNQIEDEQ